MLWDTGFGTGHPFSNGSTTYTIVDYYNFNKGARGNIALPASGNWWIEFVIGNGAQGSGGARVFVGIANSTFGPGNEPIGSRGCSYTPNGFKWGGGSSYGSSWTNGDVIRAEMSNGVLRFYKNGAAQPIAFSGLTGTWYAAAYMYDSGSVCTLRDWSG